jgi:hypothetical protein
VAEIFVAVLDMLPRLVGSPGVVHGGSFAPQAKYNVVLDAADSEVVDTMPV